MVIPLISLGNRIILQWFIFYVDKTSFSRYNKTMFDKKKDIYANTVKDEIG